MIKESSIFLGKLEGQSNAKSDIQLNAWKMLQEVGLPSKKSESYKFTPITSLLDKKVDPELRNAKTFSRENFYSSEGSHIVLFNGEFSAQDSKIESGVVVKASEVMEGKHDPFSLLNAALSTEEIVVSVAGSSSPIFIYHVNSNGLSNPRVRIKAEKNQELEIVERSINDPNTFANSYISFTLAENAEVNYSKVQAYDPNCYSHETLVVDQKRDSRFSSNIFSFSGALIRNNITINLDDENCEGNMYGLYLLDGKSHVDNNTSVDHLKPNSLSNELYKGILDEKSTGVFNGKIYVRPDAQKTNAFQTNNNILLTDNATVHTKPQLEIWADDVKCSHGCTSGQLDEDAIFYLRSRGIAEKEAKAMILNAFAADTMAKVVVPELKEEIELLISEKLG